MLHVVTALHCEAAPLIEHWGLKRLVHHRAFHLFRGTVDDIDVRLSISGIGKVRSAIATANLLANAGTPAPVVVNLGVCGGAPSFTPGQLLFAQRIVDRASGAAWCPDNVLATRFDGAELTTFERPVSTETTDTTGLALVDMEASGFAEAATLYTAPSAWAVLKVVSDHFAPATLSTEGIGAFITTHTPTIDEFCRSLLAVNRPEGPQLSPTDASLLAEFTAAYRFTASQRRLLTQAAHESVLRTGRDLTLLRRFLHREPTSKADLKEIFSEAHRALTEA